MKKFIIGWVTYKPEMREEFLEAVRLHAEATRKEPGCVFFEINPSREIANGAVVAECFASAQAHETHNATPHMRAFVDKMSRILLTGRFENIHSDDVTVDVVTYT